MMDRKYPKTIETGGEAYVIRKLAAEDAEAVQDFAKEIPQKDLLYLNRDITVSAVINAWIRASSSGAFEISAGAPFRIASACSRSSIAICARTMPP